MLSVIVSPPFMWKIAPPLVVPALLAKVVLSMVMLDGSRYMYVWMAPPRLLAALPLNVLRWIARVPRNVTVSMVRAVSRVAS